MTKRYFKVEAKCGHVGHGKCIWITFATTADNGKEAARKVRDFKRVKHDHKDAIRSTTEIDFEEFIAIKAANDEGIMAFGPYSSDGFFGLGNHAKFDAVLAMYHDQGLTPFKALAFEDGVNYTAGLPVVRTSPDHGTAYEMAGRDLADPRSMKAAIYMAIDIFNNRQSYDELIAGRMTIKLPDTEIKPRGGRIIE